MDGNYAQFNDYLLGRQLIPTYPEMFTNILFYQYTGTIHSAMAMYQHSGVLYGIEAWKQNPPNQAPFGVQHFEGEF